MNRLFSLGLIIGFFVSGVACLMITISQQLGIGLIIVAIILSFLFLNPKSPVKKHWWSVSDKIAVVNLQYTGGGARGNDKYISVYAELRPRSIIRVDRIDLETKRGKITSSDWTAKDITVDESMFVNFERPDWLGAGKHEAKLKAFTPEGTSKSGKFIVEVTKVKRV